MQTQDREVQTERNDETSPERASTDIALDDELSSLITQHETEVRALQDQLLVSQEQNHKLQWESQSMKVSSDKISEDLQMQITEYNKIQEKLQYYEEECNKLKLAELSSTLQVESDELHDLRMRLTESRSENNMLKTRVSELEVQQSSQQRETVEHQQQLRDQLAAVQAQCETLQLQVK